VNCNYFGNNKSIFNLNISSNNTYIGLFGDINERSSVNDLSISKANVSGDLYVGMLCGQCEGFINNVHSNGYVKGDDTIGGLIGFSMKNSIMNSSCEGIIEGNKFVGGLLGKFVKDSSESGNILHNSSFKGKIIGNDEFIGGLIGQSHRSRISFCYSNGSILGNSSKVGGFVGHLKWNTLINDCYSSVNVSGSNCGGFIGTHEDSTIENCYSTGKSTGGGFVGHGDQGILKNCFWDNETSDSKVGIKSGFCGGNLIGKNTSQMKIKSTFSSVGWNFESIWTNVENVTYPLLIYNLEESDPPIIIKDSTPKVGYTGDSFEFVVNCSDNYGIEHVYVEYWFLNSFHKNMTMDYYNNYNYRIIITNNSISSLYYRFHLRDYAGNLNSSEVKNISILDNDGPEFNDQTPDFGTTGDAVSFNISITDNIEISNVSLEYWFDSDERKNISLNGTEYFTYNVSIPWNSTKDLHYIFHSCDTSDNWNQTEMKTITINDNEKPVFQNDSSSTSSTTGDSFTFSINVKDNIGVHGVYVEFWPSSGTLTNASLVFSSSNYSLTIDIPEYAKGSLRYRFLANDSANNWASTEWVLVNIIDNDSPVFGTDTTPTSGTTGDQFTFISQVTDNVEIHSVFLEYWFGNESHKNVSMSGEGPYTYQIIIPNTSTETLHYIFRANDLLLRH
jgi:hypothetical protein